MADENQAQEPGQEPGQEQEQEQIQGEEQVQGEEPAQEPDGSPQDKPAKEDRNGEGLLMPFLYALLAAAGAFTLVMIIGIVVTFITRPAQPQESPSAGPSARVGQTRSSQAPDSEGSGADAAPQGTTAPASGSQGGNEGSFYVHNNPDQQQTSASYVLNTSTQKFHYPSCDDVARIAPENYAVSDQTRDEIISSGYDPCGHCDP